MSVSTSPSRVLTALERKYILLTQNGLPIIEKPYHWLAEQLELSVEDTLAITERLLKEGIIRRIAAVPNHYKLGYRYNGMTVWDVKDECISEFGQKVGNLPFVSHCYQRPRHMPGWNYNLFAMVHGQKPEEIKHLRAEIKELLKDVLVERGSNDSNQDKTYLSNDMLTSTKILKKTGLRLKKKQEEA